MKTILALTTLLLTSVNLTASEHCKVSYRQKISSDTISTSGKQSIQDNATDRLTLNPNFELTSVDEADFLIDIHALHNMDAHNANIVNVIAHMSVIDSKTNKMFSYSMHHGRPNRFGNRNKAFSEKNFNRAIERAIKKINNCESLKKPI